jgi:two-component system, NarL family, nitrate/nitrite response regulator NarL
MLAMRYAGKLTIGSLALQYLSLPGIERRMRVVVAAETQRLAEQVGQLINHRRSVELQAVLRGLDAAPAYADQCDTMILVRGTEGAACLAAIQTIKLAAPNLQIVVVNMPSDPETIVTYLEAGMTAYLPADEPLSHLPNVLRALENGEVHVDPAVAALMLDRIVNLRDQVSLPAEDDLISSLTARQRHVLNLIAHDKSNEEIADELFIEVGTVKNHVHRILQKLGARDRREAVRIARVEVHNDGLRLPAADRDADRDSSKV